MRVKWPLWKSCSDTDEQSLPKVDVRKQLLSDYESVTEKIVTENIIYLHAQTLKSAVLCKVRKAFYLVFVMCRLMMVVRIR